MESTLFDGKPILFMSDRHNISFVVSTRKELHEKIRNFVGPCRLDKMYCDKKDGRTVHTGFVVMFRDDWLDSLTAFRWHEVEV